jgi:hypothetical protein
MTQVPPRGKHRTAKAKRIWHVAADDLELGVGQQPIPFSLHALFPAMLLATECDDAWLRDPRRMQQEIDPQLCSPTLARRQDHQASPPLHTAQGSLAAFCYSAPTAAAWHLAA